MDIAPKIKVLEPDKAIIFNTSNRLLEINSNFLIFFLKSATFFVGTPSGN